jgi:hypothetical protein
VAPAVSVMFCNFYLAKYCTIGNKSTATAAKEKISTDLESLELKKMFDQIKNQSNFT